MTDNAWQINESLSALVLSLDGTAEMYLSGEFDLAGAALLEQRLLVTLASQSRLVIDLNALTFMDSAAIGVIARARRVCDANDTCLTVRVGNSPVRRLLDLAGVTEMLGVTD